MHSLPLIRAFRRRAAPALVALGACSGDLIATTWAPERAQTNAIREDSGATYSSIVQPRRFIPWISDSARYSGPSPHWRHMRVAATDYRIHYANIARNQAAEWDFAANHLDYVVGGRILEYRRRNPTIRIMRYDLLWAEPQAEAAAIERWLAGRGYDPESAFLHREGAPASRSSRVSFRIWGSDRWAVNPADPGYRAWRIDATRELVAGERGQQYDGIFIDEFNSAVINRNIPAQTLEYTSRDEYFRDLRVVLREMRAVTPAGFVSINSATYRTPIDVENILAAGGAMFEFTNTPFLEIVGAWNDIDRLVDAGATIQFSTGVSSGTKGRGRDGITRGNYRSIAERVLMWEYASYLMVVDPSNMDAILFDTYGLDWSVPMTDTWLRGFEFDIGLATGDRFVLASGTDRADQPYDVWARDFENGRVLIRPKKNWAHKRFGDATAVTVELTDGPWRMLGTDGRAGPPIMSVPMRNGEAVILVR